MEYEKHLAIITSVVEKEENMFAWPLLYHMLSACKVSNGHPQLFLLERWIKFAPRRSELGCGEDLKKFVQTALNLMEVVQTNDKLRRAFIPALSRSLAVPQKELLNYLKLCDGSAGTI